MTDEFRNLMDAYSEYDLWLTQDVAEDVDMDEERVTRAYDLMELVHDLWVMNSR